MVNLCHGFRRFAMAKFVSRGESCSPWMDSESLGAIFGVFRPAAAKRLIEMDRSLKPCLLGLRQLVCGREQGLLRLQNRQQVSRAVLVLQLGDAEGLPRR